MTSVISPSPPGQPLTIEASARAAGAWAWAERSLYEVVGGWVGSTSSADAKVYLDACSQHHAWRAQLWLERLPARLVPAGPGAPAAEVVAPQSGGAEEAMGVLAALEGDAARLGAYCRAVLPRCAVAYRGWQERCSPATDRPVARVVTLALADVMADWQEGAGVLLGLLEGPSGDEAARSAARSPGEIDRLLIGRSLVPGA